MKVAGPRFSLLLLNRSLVLAPQFKTTPLFKVPFFKRFFNMAPVATSSTDDFNAISFRKEKQPPVEVEEAKVEKAEVEEAEVEESNSYGQFKPTRDVIVSFLARCSIPYPYVPYDHDLDAETRAEGIRCGYPMEGPNSLGPFVPGGVAMASTAYKHLPNRSTQILTCLYTAFLIYLDDVFNKDIEAVREFNERFILRESQGDPVLNGFADLLLTIPRHYNRVVSNIMITSTLNLVTALLLEFETQGMELRAGAQGYPTFSRVMSGASEVYALFMFPKELPLRTYIQALPELMIFINNGNDILSFYKEESDGEVVNRVSFLADVHGSSKYEALRRLEDEAVTAHDRAVQILAPHKDASEMFFQFKNGYVGFHSGAKRYRLDELHL